MPGQEMRPKNDIFCNPNKEIYLDLICQSSVDLNLQATTWRSKNVDFLEPLFLPGLVERSPVKSVKSTDLTQRHPRI